MTILAIDPGTKLGWALSFGSEVLSGVQRGRAKKRGMGEPEAVKRERVLERAMAEVKQIREVPK